MEKCSELNTCHKIGAVLDQDWPFEEMYAQAIGEMCAECKDSTMLTLKEKS